MNQIEIMNSRLRGQHCNILKLGDQLKILSKFKDNKNNNFPLNFQDIHEGYIRKFKLYQ